MRPNVPGNSDGPEGAGIPTGAELPNDGTRDALGRFLTIADAAEILNVTAADVLAVVRSGELPAIRVGASGHWRIERNVLESYIDAMYEESRRRALWEQSDFANIPELSGARKDKPRR